MVSISEKLNLKPQLSGAGIKSLYEAEADTNAYTNAEKTSVSTALQPTETETVSGNYTFNGALYLPNNSRINNIEHFYQTTKPTTRGDSSALVAGDRWWKTDDGTEWFWNGTYWVSTQLFTASTIVSGIGVREASNFTVTQQTPHSDGGPKGLIFVESIAYYCRITIQSPLDENNFATFNYYVSTRNAISSIGEITTLEMNDYHQAQIKFIQQPFGYALGGTDGINGFYMNVGVTGSPGYYTGLGTINYRFWYR